MAEIGLDTDIAKIIRSCVSDNSCYTLIPSGHWAPKESYFGEMTGYRFAVYCKSGLHNVTAKLSDKINGNSRIPFTALIAYADERVATIKKLRRQKDNGSFQKMLEERFGKEQGNIEMLVPDIHEAKLFFSLFSLSTRGYNRACEVKKKLASIEGSAVKPIIQSYEQVINDSNGAMINPLDEGMNGMTLFQYGFLLAEVKGAIYDNINGMHGNSQGTGKLKPLESDLLCFHIVDKVLKPVRLNQTTPKFVEAHGMMSHLLAYHNGIFQSAKPSANYVKYNGDSHMVHAHRPANSTAANGSTI